MSCFHRYDTNGCGIEGHVWALKAGEKKLLERDARSVRTVLLVVQLQYQENHTKRFECASWVQCNFESLLLLLFDGFLFLSLFFVRLLFLSFSRSRFDFHHRTFQNPFRQFYSLFGARFALLFTVLSRLPGKGAKHDGTERYSERGKAAHERESMNALD